MARERITRCPKDIAQMLREQQKMDNIPTRTRKE